ncbi:MAG TPA: HlyD family type I secretion periplasmic adaptor subunit, partial [Allosphingosinicella sp.]
MSETSHIEDFADRIKPRTASNVLLWVILATFVSFIVWAALTELDRTVRGMGRIVASSQLQTVSNLEGGVVEAIYVRTGQVVAAGQELVRLDRTATGSELGSGEASIGALAAKIARLQAEVAGREPVYPAAANPAIANQIQIERSLHASRVAELASVVNAGQARILQAQRAVQEAQAAYQARVSAREARANELRVIRPLVEKGIEPRLSLASAESALAVSASEAAAASASISRAQASISEATAA